MISDWVQATMAEICTEDTGSDDGDYDVDELLE
jgi:hypothetical protein